MSRDIDPCYCEQACAYELLLRQVLHGELNADLIEEIRKTISSYEKAQEEYEAEGST